MQLVHCNYMIQLSIKNITYVIKVTSSCQECISLAEPLLYCLKLRHMKLLIEEYVKWTNRLCFFLDNTIAIKNQHQNMI